MPTTIPTSTGVMPVAVRMKEATRLSGLNKNEIYDLLKDEKIKAKKAGSKTLIILDSLFEYLKELPPYRPGVATPESAEMIEARKRLAAEQRARRHSGKKGPPG